MDEIIIYVVYMTKTMDATVHFLNEFSGVWSIDPTAQAWNLSANEAMNSTFWEHYVRCISE